MSFARMQEALRAEGWFVEWNMPCCQSCAWAEVEHDDLTKVLFNHSQDCEMDHDGEDCPDCDGDGMIDSPDYNSDEPDEHGNEQYIECDYCGGEGVLYGSFDASELDFVPDTSVDGFACLPPTACNGSMFCFDGSDEGVKNLTEMLPLITESGCEVRWNGKGNQRIEISW